MKKYYHQLLNCPLFTGISEQELDHILSQLGAGILRYGKGEPILQEGEEAISIGILLSGSVRIVRTDYLGNRSILAHISPGEVFGETYACAEGAVLPVSAVAETECACLLLNCRRLISDIGANSPLLSNLLRLVARKNMVLDQKIQVISKRTTREKLMAYLTQQSRLQKSVRFSIPFDRQALADYLEVDRSGLSSEISKLRKEGILLCHKSTFELLTEKKSADQ